MPTKPINNPPLISLNGISKTYTSDGVQTTALKPVSFKIGQGEFVAIMGPSGSGKSTLLHILGLLSQPSDGTYHLSGKLTNNISETSLAHIRNQKIGFIFQAFHLLARTSVLENVMLPLQYSAIPSPQHKSLAQNALEQVGLGHRLYHEPSQLSGGEKQRAVIARALVTKPEILLADEPTGNLDTKTGATIMDLIDTLHHQGITVIVITHETPTANFADRVITLRDGQIVSDTIRPAVHKHYAK